MTESAFERIEDACKALNLDFTSREFAFMVEEYLLIVTVHRSESQEHRQNRLVRVLR